MYICITLYRFDVNTPLIPSAMVLYHNILCKKQEYNINEKSRYIDVEKCISQVKSHIIYTLIYMTYCIHYRKIFAGS